MKIYSVFIFTVIFFYQLSHAQTPSIKSAFNGESLAGWIVPENNTWWTAFDGILSAQSGPDQKGSILWTEKEFKDFIIQLEFRMGYGTVDSGIFLRSDKQQVQIGNSGSLNRDMTGSIYISGKGYPVEASGVSQLLKVEDWNTLKVEVIRNRYKVWLNEKEILDFMSEDIIDHGPIGLQLHPNRNMAIDFRNINIAEL